mgnify:FL=1|tara:strand:- start:2553 stop:2954 length:402 start_codon:yes stop_codon:yes gene_type:complete
MKIRRIDNNDVDQVINLLVSSFSPRYNNTFFSNNLTDSRCITLVAEIDSLIVGVASLYVIQKLTRKVGLIEDVAVDSNQRGRGIGRKLIEGLIEQSNKKGCDKTILSSSEKNVPFYEKIGFNVNEIQMVLRNN